MEGGPDVVGGGARCGRGGARCGRWNVYRIDLLYWRYVGEIFSNFLKFSQMPNEGFFPIHFLILQILVDQKLSQIFSNFLGIHFYVLAVSENYLKFSQPFSNFLKILNFSQWFLWNKNTCVQGGWKFGVGGSIGWCMLGNMCFWKNVSFVLFQIWFVPCGADKEMLLLWCMFCVLTGTRAWIIQWCGVIPGNDCNDFNW